MCQRLVWLTLRASVHNRNLLWAGRSGQMILSGACVPPRFARGRGSACPVVPIRGQEGDPASCTRRVLCLALDFSSQGGGQDHGETGSGRYSWLT